MDVPESALCVLNRELRESVRGADIVGLPRTKQATADALWAAVEWAIGKHGLNGGWDATDTALHRLLQHALLYRPLLAGREFVGLISARRVGDELGRLFGIDEVHWYGVRGERDEPGNVQIPHFPDGYERMRERLRVPYRGALFLVGAGVFGKVYCHWIKQRGGIAVDIGSIFDSWAGVGLVGKGEGIALRNLDVYRRIPSISRSDAVKRYNEVACRLGLDTPVAQVTDARHLPECW